MANVCYLAISPNPQAADLVTGQKFFIKFGDGQFRPAYRVHNPSVIGVENFHSGLDKRSVPDQNAVTRHVRIGKWLEWNYIKHFAGGYSGGTEWHSVTLKQFPQINGFAYDDLRQALLHLLLCFENYDWDLQVNGQDSPASVAFELAMQTLIFNCDFSD